MRRGKKGLLVDVVAGVAIALCVSGGFVAGNIMATKGIILTPINEKVENAMEEVGNTEKYAELFEVRKALINNYDGKVDDKVLLEGAIKGMTNSLKDPYTVYMTKKEYEEYNSENAGEYVGIGVYIEKKDNKVIINAPIKGSPAEEAGIKPGDIIEKVNGEEINGDFEKASFLIKGKAGEKVKVAIKRNGEKNLLELDIPRKKIETEDVKGEILEGNQGYIQISQFNDGVTEKLKKEISTLKSKGMKGIILDLRGNPGGYLHEAVGVASQFIPKGKTITYTVDKQDKKVTQKSEGGVALGIPLVVLVDNGSASASEVVTGALRDYEIATIVGKNSFGKGIVQAPVEFKNGGALKVTISRYYTPNGENIHKKGIKPDVEVTIPDDVLKKPYNRESDAQLKKAIEVMKEKVS